MLVYQRVSQSRFVFPLQYPHKMVGENLILLDKFPWKITCNQVSYILNHNSYVKSNSISHKTTILGQIQLNPIKSMNTLFPWRIQ